LNTDRRRRWLRPFRGFVASVGWTAIAAMIGLVVAVPLVWVVFTALKSSRQVSLDPLGLPDVWHWENIPSAWQVGHFERYFGNSVLVSVPSVAITLILSLLAAYAFAVLSFKGKSILFTLFLAGLTLPESVLIIPLFYEMVALGLLNTLWALILPQIALSLPFAILLLYGFIRGLPQELLDAGRIDGCTEWSLLFQVVAPLCRPALLSLMVFNFMWAWNSFLLPMILIQVDSQRTLPAGLNYFQGRYVTNLPLLMAGAAISFLPVIVVYAIFQRQFIKGITTGAFR